jgi:uncharacterized protein YyaL (SSP411 family)
MSDQPHHTNHLIHETSPYLRQHAHNPVNWFPWGEEALQRARELDRPIFLSIGYSACHWCHVMEHESFEDPDIGNLLNDYFVSIKVDREERPDLDQIYMTAVQMMTHHGGWPMSVFLTPDLKPFYGGTYFPPEDRFGMPSFRRVLQAVLDAWQNRRAAIQQQSEEITEHLQRSGTLEPGDGVLNEQILKTATSQLRQVFDNVFGGFGRAPKFPHAMDVRLLLRTWKRFGDDSALDMVRKTLDGMARGGMYDHLGGGFHRYSTDARWLVPHFEKMLYDNALLVPAYLEAFQATGEPFYREVVEETLAYVSREMTSAEGGFFSTQDADSEGEEGKFFVWSKAEVEQVLGPELAPQFCSVYDVTGEGNWEGHNILYRTRGDEQEARLLGLPVSELRAKLDQAKQKLLEVRGRRVWPGRDEKILTSWNGLMISAFAQAGAALDRRGYVEHAEAAAHFVWGRLRTAQGRLLRTTAGNAEPRLNAYLEDYACIIEAFTRLYEASFAAVWIERALNLTDIMIDQFWDDKDGGFFFTGRDHEQLIARTKDPHDSSIPSGNSMAVTALLRLAKLTGRSDLFDRAERTLRAFSGLLSSAPLAAGQMLVALEFYLGPVNEIAVVGEPASADTLQALQLLRQGFRPRQVLAFKDVQEKSEYLDKQVPLLANKTSHGPVTVYVCRNFACQEPIVHIEALRQQEEAMFAGKTDSQQE